MRTRRALGAVLALFGLGVAVACSLEDIDFTGKQCPCGDGFVCDTATSTCVRPGAAPTALPEAGPPGCTGDACKCQTDADCKEATRAKCSPEKVCVECAQAPDSCPPGSYCNDARQCTLGCKGNDDCKISPNAPNCNLARHQCVECTTNAECGDAGLFCSPSGQCVEGCDTDAGNNCPAGKTCCNNLCLDTKLDVLNCGACGKACSTVNGTPRCSAGACAWTCASGFGHCDGTNNSGCETNLRTTVTRCGSCTRNCNTVVLNAGGISCNAGSCAFSSCNAGFGNCDSNAANGCECKCGGLQETCCPGDVCSGQLRCLGGGGNKLCKP